MKQIQNYWGQSKAWWVVLLVGILMVIAGFVYWFFLKKGKIWRLCRKKSLSLHNTIYIIPSLYDCRVATLIINGWSVSSMIRFMPDSRITSCN